MAGPTSRDCVFCRIVRREEPAGIVAEDDAILAFLDILPINPGHTLVIPKAHAATLEELPASSGGRVFEVAMAVASALRRSGLRCEGVNLHLADGSAAGQDVTHVHLHVIPRFSRDGHRIRPGPQYGGFLSPSERDRIAAKIRLAIDLSSSS